MTLDALMCATIALVHIAILCHTVGTTMRHVEIVANPLLLLVPATVAMPGVEVYSSSSAKSTGSLSSLSGRKLDLTLSATRSKALCLLEELTRLWDF